MLQKAVIVLILMFSSLVHGHGFQKEGNLKLRQLLEISAQVSNTIASEDVNRDTLGQRVMIDGSQYEIRFFTFEDTKHILPSKITFGKYIKKHKLLNMKSQYMEAMPGMEFESFDFHQANLNDGVYFRIMLRKIKKPR